MKPIINIQYATDNQILDKKTLKQYIRTALADLQQDVEVTLRIVGEVEGKGLNKQWRRANEATNVLAFSQQDLSQNDIPAPPIMEDAPIFLGDVVICAPIVAREAQEQGKNIHAHWAHLVIHGMLHLCGMDHQTPEDAERMEAYERAIMKKLNFPDPYLEKTPNSSGS